MNWVEVEPFGLALPAVADEFVGGQTLERLPSTGEAISVDEAVEMPAQLLVVVAMASLDGGGFDRAVHSLGLPVGPSMARRSSIRSLEETRSADRGGDDWDV